KATHLGIPGACFWFSITGSERTKNHPEPLPPPVGSERSRVSAWDLHEMRIRLHRCRLVGAVASGTLERSGEAAGKRAALAKSPTLAGETGAPGDGAPGIRASVT